MSIKLKAKDFISFSTTLTLVAGPYTHLANKWCASTRLITAFNKRAFSL